MHGGLGGKIPDDVCNQFRTIYGNSITGEIPEGAGQAERRVGKGPKGGGRGRTQILWGGRKFPRRNLTLSSQFLNLATLSVSVACRCLWLCLTLTDSRIPSTSLKQSCHLGSKRPKFPSNTVHGKGMLSQSRETIQLHLFSNQWVRFLIDLGEVTWNNQFHSFVCLLFGNSELILWG